VGSTVQRISSAIEHFERFLGIGSAQDEQSFLRIGRRGAIAVFDIDSSVGELLRNARERSWFVVAFDHNDVGLDDECAAFLEEQERLARVADYHANDTVIDVVAGSYGINIDFGGAESLADARQHAWPIFEEKC